jgi:hypothetical protein
MVFLYSYFQYNLFFWEGTKGENKFGYEPKDFFAGITKVTVKDTDEAA